MDQATGAGMTPRIEINEASVPALPRGVRLRHDQPREQWVLLAPERMFVLDETALAIIRLCDSRRTVAEIIDSLAADYAAPREVIAKDVLRLLQDFADKSVVAA